MLELPDQMNQFTITFNASCSSPIEPLSDRRPQKIIKYQKNHHMYARYYNSSQLWLSVVWKDLNFFLLPCTPQENISNQCLWKVILQWSGEFDEVWPFYYVYFINIMLQEFLFFFFCLNTVILRFNPNFHLFVSGCQFLSIPEWGAISLLHNIESLQ